MFTLSFLLPFWTKPGNGFPLFTLFMLSCLYSSEKNMSVVVIVFKHNIKENSHQIKDQAILII